MNYVTLFWEFYDIVSREFKYISPVIYEDNTYTINLSHKPSMSL